MHGASFERGARLSPDQKRVLDDITQCRTAALGGHLYRCDHCGHVVPVYNSCLNRHCPNCQTLKSESWADQRKAELLPVQYFHDVFTLPHEFNPLALANKAVVYKIFFDAVSATLLHFGRTRLKGTLGILAILHTWDQLLGVHIHIHCLIPGGALSFDRQRWNRPLKDNFLFSVEDLSAEFRTRFLGLLKDAYQQRRLSFPTQLQPLSQKQAFEVFLQTPSAKHWVVYSKPSFVDPAHAIGYLSRYTHRVAISNSRIRQLSQSSVTISYIDRKDGGVEKQKTFHPHEFLQRFLDHVLPAGFHRIRYYGLFNNRIKRRLLPAALMALGEAPLLHKPEKKTPTQWILERTGNDITLCPRCRKGALRPVQVLCPQDLRPLWRLNLWFSHHLLPPSQAP
jgi:hypothetical protein